MLPALAAGVALVNATVISDDQTQRNRRLRWLVLVLRFRRFWRRGTSILDGKRVHIRMQFVRKIFAKSFPTVIRSEERRSEEHTSELQSHSDLVCRLLLEKKKK